MSEKKYFAAANTVNGFVSYYDEIFGKCSKIYIIKGGSGTGKSYFMRRCAEYVKGLDAFEDIEYFYCSFDPSSLDGILINGDVAVIDGTAPHVYEPKMPGAKENIVDLGRFWDADKLRESRDTFSDLFEKKKNCFKRAYGYLSACGELDKVREGIISEYIDDEKLRAAAAKLVSDIECDECEGSKLRIVSALGRDGRVLFDTYEGLSERTIKVANKDGAAHWFLENVILEARRFGKAIYISYDPLFINRPNAVMIGNTAIMTADCESSKWLETESDKISKLKAVQNELVDEAIKEFRRAAEVHFSIEKIYASAMDFGRKEEFTEDFLKKFII